MRTAMVAAAILLTLSDCRLQAQEPTSLSSGDLNGKFSELYPVPPVSDGPSSPIMAAPVENVGMQITPLQVEWMPNPQAPSRADSPPAEPALELTRVYPQFIQSPSSGVNAVAFTDSCKPVSAIKNAGFEKPLYTPITQDEVIGASFRSDALTSALDELHYGKNCSPLANCFSQPCSNGCEYGEYYQPCVCNETWRSFTVFAGTMLLHRSQVRNRPLVFRPGSAQSIATDDFDFGLRGGHELGINFHELYGPADLEVRYFDVTNWNDNERMFVPNGLTRLATGVPIDLAGLNRRTFVRYSNTLSNLEFNWRIRTGDECNWLTFSAGYRQLNLYEALNVRSFGATSEQLTLQAKNRLHGMQVGVDATIIGFGGCCIEAYAKAGIYGNADRITAQFNSIVPPAATMTASDQDGDRVSYASEVGVKARWQFTDYIHGYARYQLLVLDQVSLASDQFAVTDLGTGAIGDTNGTALFHGATVGLQFAY